MLELIYHKFCKVQTASAMRYNVAMKVLIFYRPESEQSRAVDEFVHEFNHRHPGAELTLVDVDSVNGSRQAAVYDVMRHPTVIATGDDGSALQRWDNGLMPLINEVAYYTSQ